jgi:putative ABC transport system permease protein
VSRCHRYSRDGRSILTDLRLPALNRVRKNSCFVSGHDFSRAVNRLRIRWALAPEVLLSCPVHAFSAACKAIFPLQAPFPAVSVLSNRKLRVSIDSRSQRHDSEALINKLVLSNLAHRPVRTILSVLAIAVEVTMILTLVGVSYGTLDGTARRARGVGADIMIRPKGSAAIGLSTAPIPDLLLGVVAQQPHVALATGTAIQPLSGFDSITGLDLDTFSRMSGGFHYLQGGPFQTDQDMLVDEYYAREKGLHVGDKVQLVSRTWNIAGIFESGKLARICVRLPVLQELMVSPHKLSQIFVKADSQEHVQQVLEELRAKLPGYPIYTVEEFTSLLSINSVGLLRSFIGVVIGVAVTVGFIVVFMAMYTAVLERTREIGILKAVGASSGFILNLLLRETILLSLLGALVGILFTYVTQWLMQYAVPASLTQETVYAWWPIAGAIAVGGALLGVIVPAVRAVKQDATEALSYE